MELRGLRTAVVGVGVSNIALIRFLLKRGAKVTACDAKTATELGDRYHELRELGVDIRLGEGYLESLGDFDVLFLTPGMKKSGPEIEEALRRGTKVSCEAGLFLELCERPVIGITGSAGKSTTTSLVGEILKTAGRNVIVGGNIGQPLIEYVDIMPENAWIVMELSSFQLELVRVSPHVGAILNITPNHLDVHPSMEHYVNAKQNVVLYQKPEDCAVLNFDQDLTRGIARTIPSRTAWFSLENSVSPGAFLDGDRVVLHLSGNPVEVVRAGSLRLKGRHNVANFLAAVTIGGLSDCPVEAMRIVARQFKGLEHRLEEVAELNGVRFVNDSIATTPERAIAGLRSFSSPVVLIAGGYNKKLDFSELGREIVRRVKALVLLGAARDKIREAVEVARAGLGEAGPEVVEVREMSEAVEVAYGLSVPGDVVLLSPACASYDMFANFEERGRKFTELANALSGTKPITTRERCGTV